MQIQINTDKNVSVSNEQISATNAFITKELSRFSEQITRVEVHLSDTDGSKDGPNDKRCLIEARLSGLKPMVASDNSNTFDQAVSGALEKLKASITSLKGRLEDQ